MRALVRLTVVGTVLLAGCAASTPDPATPPTGSAAEHSPEVAERTEPSAPTEAAVVRDVHLDGQDVQLAVGPVAVADGVAILRITGTPTSGTEQVYLGFMFYSTFVGPHPSGNAVRLLDLERGEVRSVARNAGGSVVAESGGFPVEAGGEPAVLHVAFDAPDSPTVDVLVPRAGLFTDVPVVPAQDVDVMPLADLTDDAAGDLDLPVARMETYTETAGGDVRTRVAEDEVRVQVSADVLFAFDSADLGPEADAALAVAAEQLTGHAGAVRIVGHTDDQGDAAYNQDLSERRAASVADRLATLVDTDPLQVVVEGKGEDEPIADGTSEEARSLNRRVELRFVPTDSAPESSESSDAAGDDVPETTGPVAAGPDGLTVEVPGADERYDVQLAEVHRRHGHLVGEVELTNSGDTEIGGVALLAAASWDPRGQFAPHLQTAATKLTVLRGATRAFPVDYVTESGGRDPVADRLLNALGPGESVTVTVVWPDVGGDTVVVDSPQMVGSTGHDVGGPPFRLVDVPVTGG